MSKLQTIAQTVSPGQGRKLRAHAYGPSAAGTLLRDVITLANAEVDGPRYIFCGVHVAESGQRKVPGIASDAAAQHTACLKLVHEYIEPVLRIAYETVALGDATVGVFTIDACHDQPYMMRIDYSPNLRRGEAWLQMRGMALKLGRSQLQKMFSKHFQESTANEALEIGFDGDVVSSDLQVSAVDMEQLPSALAAAKIRQLIEMLSNAADTGASSRIGRLGHARLFGADSAYDKKSVPELIVDLKHVKDSYREHDEFYFFETCATKVQLVVINQGEDKLRDATLTLSMPHHAALLIAQQLPRVLQGDQFEERSPFETDGYPPVAVGKQTVRISLMLGDILPDSPKQVFDVPLRIAIGPQLAGRRIGIHYELQAANLRLPQTGKLRLRVDKKA